MEYIGEHLLPGQLGHFAILLGFVSSLLAAVSYTMATNRNELPEFKGWRNIGRLAFGLHGLCILAAIGIIFYMMANQYYEYQYVQAHVSEELPSQYIFSAFWEGQEGSFLLWMFWHIVLGTILMFTAKSWEGPVMAVLSAVQLVIVSMIVGLYVDLGPISFKLGSSPMLLLRDVVNAPIFANADYLSLIKGNGLNPLLQNYWMTIHPPTLFLGFASTVVPFCFAVAGLWTGRHREWLKPVMPWALFTGAILGTGILMGGAWAYEALSFGGYWAWDPVENASLVPWLILLAGIHTNLIANKTGYSIRSTYLFYLLTFLLIVYSTFLTRSGVLGETSVHAFTEMGLEWQLIIFILASTALGGGFLAARWKDIPTPKKEEASSSREFWMFIGSLVLLFSAALITASTSLPVFNKIAKFFDPEFTGRTITEPITHYNKYQLWIGVFIGLLSGGVQYLRFKEFNWKGHQRKFWIHTAVASVVSVALTALTIQWINANAWQYVLLLFTGIFAVISNLDYLIIIARGNLKMASSAFAHIGFGLMIVGVLASGLNKEFISENRFAQEGLIEGFEEEDYNRNILLLKGIPMFMRGYEVTYVEDTIDTYTRTFQVDYKRKNKLGEVIEEFTLYPNVLYDKSFTKIAASNPSTKHYLHRDIFTHIASLPKAMIDPNFAQQMEDSLNYTPYEMAIGDTIFTTKYYAILEETTRSPMHPDYEAKEKDIALGVKLAVRELNSDSVWYAEPMLAVNGTMLYGYPDQINDLGIKVKMPQKAFEQYFDPGEDLEYQPHVMKQGDEFYLNGYKVRFKGFQPKPTHPDYIPQEGDIAVSALLDITTPDQRQIFESNPVYLIRNSRPFIIQDRVDELGWHFRFTELDPNAQTGRIEVAIGKVGKKKLTVDIAEDATRSDYIVLEAIVFPGINFFWVGSIMMMLGLLLGFLFRLGRRGA
ncbi:MAG: cytochrome c biogenesis protein CcsA [Bacteroidota bacterium]